MTPNRSSQRVVARSGIPLYVQLRKILADEIATLKPGEQLSSESAISERFRVSRATVRQAIAELESAGLIDRKRGAGTFVSHRRNAGWKIQSEHGWYEEMTRRGHAVETRVLFNGLAIPPPWMSEALELPVDAQAIRLDRVRSVDGEVATIVHSYLHPQLCAPVLDARLDGTSLYGWLEEQCALFVSTGTRTIRAVAAPTEIAGKLGVPRGVPLLVVEAVSSDASAGPFEVYECWHRADRTSIEVSVAPSGDAQTDALFTS